MYIHSRRVVLVVVMALVSAHAQLSIKVDRGSLQIQESTGATLSNISLRLQLKEWTVSGALESAGEEHGSDAAGKYDLQRYRLRTEGAESIQATLELRCYHSPEVIVATLVYEGPPPVAKIVLRTGRHTGEKLCAPCIFN